MHTAATFATLCCLLAACTHVLGQNEYLQHKLKHEVHARFLSKIPKSGEYERKSSFFFVHHFGRQMQLFDVRVSIVLLCIFPVPFKHINVATLQKKISKKNNILSFFY